MIYGLGHDIIEIKRIRVLLQGNSHSRFIARILTEKERSTYESSGSYQAEFTAGRFAAKEAIAKAFGTGIGKYISFQDLEVLPSPCGKPLVHMSKAAWQHVGLSSMEYHIHLSISHQPSIASAQAIVEQRSTSL